MDIQSIFGQNKWTVVSTEKGRKVKNTVTGELYPQYAILFKLQQIDNTITKETLREYISNFDAPFEEIREWRSYSEEITEDMVNCKCDMVDNHWLWNDKNVGEGNKGLDCLAKRLWLYRDKNKLPKITFETIKLILEIYEIEKKEGTIWPL